ncbi:hypothetical protein QE152_g10776 [Popillia japonica]|uniref:Uncharacterized protein n=1 Tax=Popillia japonica TaxID=7064 RepID=A0AAW1LV96_POPJA
MKELPASRQLLEIIPILEWKYLGRTVRNEGASCVKTTVGNNTHIGMEIFIEEVSKAGFTIDQPSTSGISETLRLLLLDEPVS